MPTFLYKAKTGPGKPVQGLLEAESRLTALDKLSRLGYVPITLEETAPDDDKTRPWTFQPRIRPKDLSLFTRQLADLLESGLPLIRALEVVEVQTENKRLARLLRDIRDQIKGGRAFSDAMEQFPRAFSPVYVNLVRAGEVGGVLGAALNRLSELTEQEDDLRSRLQAAMAYPLLIAVVGVATLFFLLTFVVPRLAGMFSETGQALPLLTRLLIGASDLLIGYWWVPVVALAGLVAALRSGHSLARQAALDQMLLSLPLWGPLMKKVAIARFARTLGTLLASGVPILDALQVVSHVLGHAAFQAQVMEASRSVQQGASLAESLRPLPAFPAFLCHMIAVGEEGNMLEKSLQKVAATYEREADRALKMMTTLLEPAMILAIGSVIGAVVICMLLPIFQISVFVK
jgi:general secretion pathway protein F